ncbi:hypothetical protein EAG_06214 [Camponotus floridanus]|uniref:Uncharacterized protein n=1 Tax=Camponotus floridanus TaxID=104421 RepID=E2AH05_CAMFO|nr:hypothetical protein EAG_06214 [Camponotus floridanus]
MRTRLNELALKIGADRSRSVSIGYPRIVGEVPVTRIQRQGEDGTMIPISIASPDTMKVRGVVE